MRMLHLLMLPFLCWHLLGLRTSCRVGERLALGIGWMWASSVPSHCADACCTPALRTCSGTLRTTRLALESAARRCTAATLPGPAQLLREWTAANLIRKSSHRKGSPTT